jgi:hypothetical protein
VRLVAWGVAQVVFRQHNGTAKKFLHTMGGFTLGYCPPFTGRGLLDCHIPRPAIICTLRKTGWMFSACMA